MKSYLFISLFSAAMALPTFAASYTLNNGSGATASGVSTSTGTTFSNTTPLGSAFPSGGGVSAGPGIVAIGIFSTDDLSSLSRDTLISSFTQFSASTNTYAAQAATGNRGVFSLATSATVLNSTFAGQFIYLFSGNGTTFANSTEFLVVKSGFTFNAADDTNPNPISLTLRPETATTLFGSEIANVQTANTDGSVTAGFQMAAPVPEPSALLLGSIGALGLLRRRRI